MHLTGSTFLVAGGSSGLGSACAKKFVESGANVVIADLNPPPDETLVESVRFAKTDVREEADVRIAIETACEATSARTLARGLALQGEALAAFREEGVQVHTWSPELLARFRRASAEVMEEASASDPDFAEAWASLQAFRAAHDPWAEIATVPDADGAGPGNGGDGGAARRGKDEAKEGAPSPAEGPRPR